MKLPHYPNAHLAYCTNIHPAETWEETFQVLKTHTLQVRDKINTPEDYAIGLRLSALAASELLEADHLTQFKNWLDEENCYVFTINGFPFGSFHGTRVKEQVYRPDWTETARLDYTIQLFEIIAQLVPEGIEGSVSTLPGSFKEFGADEITIFNNLEKCASKIEQLSKQYNRDLHLGLEPEPLGHFENTEETLAFYERFFSNCLDPELIRRRIGINYDTCHFALEFDDCQKSLDSLINAGLRISKVHLSSALEFDPTSDQAMETIQKFDEPTYLHQVILLDDDGFLTRYRDLPEFFSSLENPKYSQPDPVAGRIHFHIPLYHQPNKPLGSTQIHVLDTISYFSKHPQFCNHFEIETYTWGVLPHEMQIEVEDQIAHEYQWVLDKLSN